MGYDERGTGFNPVFCRSNVIYFKKAFFSPMKRYLLLSLAMSLVVLAEQLVAAVMLGVILLTLLYDLIKRTEKKSVD